MTDQQISALINALRYTNQITPLQKDILDTWDALQKNPLMLTRRTGRSFSTT